MTTHDEINTAPPTEADPLRDEAPPTRWPTVFGVISIIYAILGLCCFSLQGAWMMAMDFIPEVFRGGVNMPLTLRLVSIGMIVPVLILGVMLLTGGIGLVRRKRSSVGLLKKWVVLRLVMLLLGLIVTVLTAPAQMEIQKQIHEFQSRVLEEAGRAPPPARSDDELWFSVMLQAGIGTAVVAIYPFTLGMFLSRSKIDEEVAEWR